MREATSTGFIINASKKLASDTSWFDGSSASIYDRLERVQEMIDSLKTAASNNDVSEGDLRVVANNITTLESDRDLLQKTASEYVDFDTEEYLQSLPGGTVASQYQVGENGLLDLGEDDGSFLFQAASEVQGEYKEYDWTNFVTAGAESWVYEQLPELTTSQLATREAACTFAEKKTSALLDVGYRAAVIDNFLDNVEICRREKTSGARKQAKASRLFTARKELTESYVYNKAVGNNYNWL